MPTNRYILFAESLNAIAFGPFMSEPECLPLFDVPLSELQRISRVFTPASPMDDSLAKILNNAILYLIGIEHGASSGTWVQWISVTPSQLESFLDEWREELGWD